MRVLFPDYDGVLHPLGLQLKPAPAVVNTPADAPVRVDFFCWVDLLAEILADHPDVRLVVHSSWRDSHTVEALGAYLGPLRNRYLGATSSLPKYESILQWVAENPAVTTFRILDDSVEEFPADPPPDEFIACDYQTGLTDPAVQQRLRDWLQATGPR